MTNFTPIEGNIDVRDSRTIPNTTNHLHPGAWGPIIVAVIVICTKAYMNEIVC